VATTAADAVRRIGIKLAALGGWADPGDAPSAAATREILEETGYHSSAVKLIACWDRELQGHPPPVPVHVYKPVGLLPGGSGGAAADQPDGGGDEQR